MTDQDIRHAVRKIIYGCLVTLAAALAIGVGNVAYTNHVDGRRRHAEQVERDARARTAFETTQLVCQLAIAQSEALRDATSPAGIKSRDTWIALAHRFSCIP